MCWCAVGCGRRDNRGVRWRMGPFVPAADREWVGRLWVAAMPPSWPLLPAGIAMLADDLVAEAGTGPVGVAAADRAGGVPLILVHLACQGRGIGTGLLAAAVDALRAGGAGKVWADGGGDRYIWPGVPQDLPGAVAFFTARGWRHGYDTLDLVADLAGYQPPAAAAARAAGAGVSPALARAGDLAEVRAFEAATFPPWVRWFRARTGGILIARDAEGKIAGTLLLDGPDADTVYAPMLGPAAGTIGCVGVAPPLHGRGIGTALVTGHRNSCHRPAPVPATSAGPPARPSTAGSATSPGGDTPCSTARPGHGPRSGRS
jgi:beta-N-acetylhexosaminidase